jgi:hypothetical protein
MYITYFSLFSYILSPKLLYPLLYKYTVILKLHILNIILLPTSSYSAGVLPQFLFIYQYTHLFCSICLHFLHIPCNKIPSHQLLIQSHFKLWPLISRFCISLPPDYIPIPSTTLCCSFFPAFVYVHRSVHLFPNCCKESATFGLILFAIFCIFYLLTLP